MQTKKLRAGEKILKIPCFFRLQWPFARFAAEDKDGRR
jgi:hypothetical protein